MNKRLLLGLRGVVVLLIGLTMASQSFAQSVTCTTTGNQTNCTDWNAVGRNIGAGIGNLIASLGPKLTAEQRQDRDLTFYPIIFCTKNPGQLYKGQRCPTEEERIGSITRTWLYDHPKFRANEANAAVMVAYMQEHKLDPLKYNDYNKAFNQLKKANAIELNK